MIIRHLSTPHPPSKPQVHTRKNHDIYNGILHLPLTTHVRVDYDYYRPNNTNSNRHHSPQYPRYIVTLTYAHNRACEIYRSHDDVVTLRQALLAAGCHTTLPPQPAAAAVGKSRSSSKIDRSRACSCRCTCAVACPVVLPVQRRLRVVVDDTSAARELQQLLEEGLKKVREGGEGGGRARVSVEWFLRRRVGDCGGR
ncbi:hypothetical protein C8A03DRAFT_13634 [Achaetomium macrosporum]|uniref:Uncharacterized protein n=1 Tax=Achaetomium macrosporum TaxID=79813 RepID=A0AAN7HCR7_9PEZI|nr:hypothetical protein C8A03DRAFT_13634 [Achaetomium macrosporum]